MKQPTLRSELLAAGSNAKEAETLEKLAGYVGGRLPVRHLSRRDRKAILQRIMASEAEPRSLRRSLFQALGTAGALTALFGLIVLAQSSLPGGTLYAIKRASETARVKVQPSFQETVVKRRQDEVNDLRNSGAPATLIQKTEDDLVRSTAKLESQSGRGSNNSGSGSPSSGSSTSKDESKTEVKGTSTIKTEDKKGSSNSGSGSSGSSKSGSSGSGSDKSGED